MIVELKYPSEREEREKIDSFIILEWKMHKFLGFLRVVLFTSSLFIHFFLAFRYPNEPWLNRVKLSDVYVDCRVFFFSPFIFIAQAVT